MAVQLEFTSVVIPLGNARKVLPRGQFNEYLQSVWWEVSWYDNFLLREGAMSTMDAEDLIAWWDSRGINPISQANGKQQWDELCLVDYFDGPTLDCSWLMFDPKEHTVWSVGHPKGPVIGPKGRSVESNPVRLDPSQ